MDDKTPVLFNKDFWDVFKANSTMVMTKDEKRYYLFPFWMEEVDEQGMVCQYSFEHLPQDLRDAINDLRMFETK